MFIGVIANQRLQQRGRQLIGQGNHADLHEAEVKIGLQDRVNRQDQRLDHIVEQVRHADGAKDGEGGSLHCAALGGRHRALATVGHIIISLISC